MLENIPGLVVTPDVTVNVQGSSNGSSGRAPAAVFAEQSGASELWAQGNTGQGVNVAVLDTGISPLPDFAGRLVDGVDLSGGNNPWDDQYGHGTFVAGLIAGNGASSGGQYTGEAPGAGLVSVKVAGASGQTDLATVIEGVGWTIAHESVDNIRVLNMSLGSVPSQSTVLNPLDHAVEAAWESGIVVTVSAGNDGPDNGTILSPGDDPMVITAGAVDDLGQTNPADDAMTTFSSIGPTDPDGWFKPDLVTSGRSVVSLRDPGSTIDTENPSARVGSANFVGSGTSFSSAITGGAAALLLSDHPYDTPNTVKGTLLGTTAPGPVGNPFVDGHGILDVAAADASTPMTLNQSPPRWSRPSARACSSACRASRPPGTRPTGPARRGTARPGTARPGTARRGTARPGTARPGTARPGTARPGTARPGTARPGTARPGTARPGTARPGTDRPGTDRTDVDTTAKARERREPPQVVRGSSLALWAAAGRPPSPSLCPGRRYRLAGRTDVVLAVVFGALMAASWIWPIMLYIDDESDAIDLDEAFFVLLVLLVPGT